MDSLELSDALDKWNIPGKERKLGTLYSLALVSLNGL